MGHALKAITVTNSDHRIALCECGEITAPTPPERGPGGGLLQDQSPAEKRAAELHRQHAQRERADA